MVIVTKVSYPTESSKEMAKKFLEAPQMPDYIVRKGPYVTSNTCEGIHVMTVSELDNSRLAEGLDFTASYMTLFYGIPGFKYEMRPYFEVEEALKLLGMG